MSSAPPPSSRGDSSGHLSGIATFLASLFFFGALDTVCKWLSQHYPVTMIVWVRYITQTVLMLMILWPRVGFGLVRTRALTWQVIRALVLLSISVVFLLALSLMPIAEATAINFMSPLILTAMSVWILGEHVRPGA